jgi:hypothetical protein
MISRPMSYAPFGPPHPNEMSIPYAVPRWETRNPVALRRQDYYHRLHGFRQGMRFPKFLHHEPHTVELPRWYHPGYSIGGASRKPSGRAATTLLRYAVWVVTPAQPYWRLIGGFTERQAADLVADHYSNRSGYQSKITRWS